MKLAALALGCVLAACGAPRRHAHARAQGDGDGSAAAAGAAASAAADDDGPRTHDAAARARAEAAEHPDERVSGDGKHWGGWQYQGARDDCFFVVGRRCFSDEKKACAAARCPGGECELVGGGPATVQCAK